MLSVLCCVDDHFVSSVVYRAKASHDGRTVALKKVQIFEMMDSKVSPSTGFASFAFLLLILMIRRDWIA